MLVSDSWQKLGTLCTNQFCPQALQIASGGVLPVQRRNPLLSVPLLRPLQQLKRQPIEPIEPSKFPLPGQPLEPLTPLEHTKPLKLPLPVQPATFFSPSSFSSLSSSSNSSSHSRGSDKAGQWVSIRCRHIAAMYNQYLKKVAQRNRRGVSGR